MSKKDKKQLYSILISAGLFFIAILIPLESPWRLFLFLPPYLVVGGSVLLKCIQKTNFRQIFDENFLMSIATIGAFALGEYPEAVMVMILYQVGELFQSYAVGKSRRSIQNLMNIRPDYANIKRNDTLEKVAPEEVQLGDIIVVKTGEKIPLDGIVLEGSASVDTAALTGESITRSLSAGAEALSGCINLNGLLTIQVTKIYEESTVAIILDLVENASDKKSRAENFITKFARYYTPLIVFAALILAVIPPLLIPGTLFSDWIHRALTFLVISCPCALVISVPLSFFGGIGGASKCGILIKGSNYLESLSRVESVVFDKTGTLTKGRFCITKIVPAAANEVQTDEIQGNAAQTDEVQVNSALVDVSSADAVRTLLTYAALAESYSSHPIARSILEGYGQKPDTHLIKKINEVAGQGVVALLTDELTIRAGNRRLLFEAGISTPDIDVSGTVVHLAKDNTYLGYIVISDEIKSDAQEAISLLKRKNKISRTVMLSGDHPPLAQKVGDILKIDSVYAGLLPAEKVVRMEELMADKKSPNSTLAYVGDGINDAPVLARADIGIAMGGLGSDAAIEAADVVIMDDQLTKINLAIDLAKRTIRIVKQNIVFALGVKGIFLLAGALGLATMWAAVFADVGVSVIAILNAMRALQVKKYLL